MRLPQAFYWCLLIIFFVNATNGASFIARRNTQCIHGDEYVNSLGEYCHCMDGIWQCQKCNSEGQTRTMPNGDICTCNNQFLTCKCACEDASMCDNSDIRQAMEEIQDTLESESLRTIRIWDSFADTLGRIVSSKHHVKMYTLKFYPDSQASMDEKIENMQEGLDSNGIQLDSLGASITGMPGSLMSMSGKLDGLQESMDDSVMGIETIQATLNSISTQVSKIDQLDSKLAALADIIDTTNLGVAMIQDSLLASNDSQVGSGSNALSNDIRDVLIPGVEFLSLRVTSTSEDVAQILKLQNEIVANYGFKIDNIQDTLETLSLEFEAHELVHVIQTRDNGFDVNINISNKVDSVQEGVDIANLQMESLTQAVSAMQTKLNDMAPTTDFSDSLDSTNLRLTALESKMEEIHTLLLESQCRRARARRDNY
eukprot:m.13016 g.13016  ORF g.13016 m.13016 type:complete len:427 (-) comp4771_c0_seq1:1682-2962(-)